jgi:radical SAM superfamily enzyme YgiQ (UPF0313 family)
VGHALLINPSSFRTYGSTEGGIAFPVYPLVNLASIAGALRQRGHTVRILDLSYRPYDTDMIRGILDEERPDVVGLTATTPLMNQVRDLSFLIEDTGRDILTVAGGAHVSALPEASLAESALDIVVKGEGDFVLADLLDGTSPDDIAGLYLRDGDGCRSTGPGRLLDDLDDLPMPAWGDYPLESAWKSSRMLARHLPVGSVEFSRGCIYTCDFCASKNTMGRGYRKKSPERCADELELLARHGFREAALHDDIFTTDTDWAAAVCEEIIRRDLDFHWSCSNGIRVDAVDRELYGLMERAGCYRVYFGFETGNDEVLKGFGKGGRATLDRGVEAVRLAIDAGLDANGYFMVGLLPDTEASMQDTIDYARSLPLNNMKCGICVPYPGTPMFNELHAKGRIKTVDWDNYTVYNRAENIFDHPTLDWPTITAAFDRFYRDVYVRNPRYIWRRFWFLLRTGDLLHYAWYTLRFLRMISGKRKPPPPEAYAYEARWRPLDLPLDEPLPDHPVPRVRRRGTALRVRTGRTAAAS